MREATGRLWRYWLNPKKALHANRKRRTFSQPPQADPQGEVQKRIEQRLPNSSTRAPCVGYAARSPSSARFRCPFQWLRELLIANRTPNTIAIPTIASHSPNSCPDSHNMEFMRQPSMRMLSRLIPSSGRGAGLVEHLRQLLALLLGGPLTGDAVLVRPLIQICVPRR